MKPLQNQYQDLLEGKMSKFNFLNNIKRSLPNLVSNVTSFEDAVKILKSKRILSENIYNTPQMGGVTTSKGTTGYINNPDKKGGDYDPKARAASLARLANLGPKKPMKEISANYLIPGNSYEYNGGAESVVLKYVGKREDNPDIKVGSSMGKGHIFQWPDGKHFELGPISVSKYIENIDIDDENIVSRYEDEQEKHALPGGHMLEKKKSLNETKALDMLMAAVDDMFEPGTPENQKLQDAVDDAYFRGDIDTSAFSHEIGSVSREVASIAKEIGLIKNEVINRLSEGKYTLNKYVNEIDSVNPIEYQNGISFEVDLAGDFSAQGLEKAVKKVLKNLKKDPIYYTNLKASLGQKASGKKVHSSEYAELKKDNQIDKHNQLKTLVKKEMANTKTTQSKQEKASKAMPKGVKLIKENKLEKLEHIKSLLSNETLKNSSIGYFDPSDPSDEEVVIIYKNAQELPADDLAQLNLNYRVWEDIHSEPDERKVVEYRIYDRRKQSKPTPSKSKFDDEDIFESKDDKKRQEKDFEDFSKRMIGKKPTKQNTIKDKIKEYVVKQLKKEAVKFTIGNEKEYVSDAESKGFEDKLRKAGVTKFTKSKVQ